MTNRPARRRNNAAEVRAKLLDSAEALFAARGFSGVSIRDIVAHAGVRISTLTYHFQSKDFLFAQVIARRANEYIQAQQDSLTAAIKAFDDHPPVEALIRAYLTPSFHLVKNGGEGWKNYIELAIRSMNLRENEEALAPLWREMVPTQKILFEAFRKIFASADLEDLHWAVHFLAATTMHMLLEVGLVDRQSDGLCRSNDLPRILEKMIPFYAAGFNRLVSEAPCSANSTSPARRFGEISPVMLSGGPDGTSSSRN